MKALLVLALLSIASIANASVDLSCEAEGSTKTNRTVMIKEGKNFKITKLSVENNKQKTVVTNLYTKNVVKNKLGDTLYMGLAETKYCIDGCEVVEDFTVKIPQILENRVLATFRADYGDGKEVTKELYFRCVLPPSISR